MLYETLSQPYVISILLIAGLLCGIIFDIANLFTYLCNNNKISKQIFLFFATFFTIQFLYFVNLKINFGQFRFYVIFVFFFAFFIQRFLSKKFIAKIIKWCYNKFENFKKRIRKQNRNEKDKG